MSNQVSGVNLRVTPSKYQREVCFTVHNCEKAAGNLNFEYLIVKICCNESENCEMWLLI